MATMKLAEVKFSTGRFYLNVAGITVAIEGDKCRGLLPEFVSEPIPEDELENATIGDKKAKDLPLHVVRWFRGDRWRKESLEWAASRINAVAGGEAKHYNEAEAIPREENSNEPKEVSR